MNELHKELRLRNLINIKLDIKNDFIDDPDLFPILIKNKSFEIESICDDLLGLKVGEEVLMFHSIDLESIPLTKENIEKYIDWGFEKGFNKWIVDKEYWIGNHFLMENAIDGSSDFEIIFSEHKEDPELNEIMYYIDDKLLEFGLDDTLNNLQNLFYISSGQELPIKKQ